MSTLKHSVSENKAKQLTSHYEKKKDSILKKRFHGKAILPTSETFDRAAFDQLLSQDGCVGVRIYYGMDEESNVKLVAVGVYKDDQDILTSKSNLKKAKGDNIADEPVFALSDGLRCPPFCPPPPPPPAGTRDGRW